MFAKHGRRTSRDGKHTNYELGQLAVTYYRDVRGRRNIHLFKDVAGGRKRLNKYGFIVSQRIRNGNKVAVRQHQVLRKGAIAALDSEHRSLRTVTRAGTQAL